MAQLLEYITLFRVVWIGGRLGFGKTALSVYLMNSLIKMGFIDGVVSNFPTVIPVHWNKDDGMLHGRGIIYDEAWADLDSRSSMTNERSYSAYARKMGTVWIFPSVHPIDKRLRAVTIKPMYRSRFTGRVVWQYVISDDEKNPTTGKFSVDLKTVYGMYATSYIPVGDCGIKDRFALSYEYETGQSYGVKDKENKARQDRELSLAALQEIVGA